MCVPFLLLTYTEGGIKCVLYVIQSLSDSILHTILLERGMVYGSAHTEFTCQLLHIRAHFQLGFLLIKQEAASSFPHSFEYPLPVKPTRLSQLTSHNWASPTYQLEKRAERERERDWFPVSLLSPSRLFWNACFTPALLALLSNSLYGGLS